MATNSYTGQASSGNITNLQAIAEILKAADVVEVFDKLVKTIPASGNSTDTVGLLRAVTPEVIVQEVSEGVNPTSLALTYEKVERTFQEFALVMSVTSRQAELGEYDVVADSKNRIVDLMKRIREKNAWFEYRAGNGVVFHSAAITARNQVNGPITLGALRRTSDILLENRASYMVEMTKGSVNQKTVPMQAAFPVLFHVNGRADVRNIPGFVPRAQIGGYSDTMPNVFGTADEFLFISTPELEPFLGAGAAVGATGMKSVGGTNVDVYPFLVFGKDALGKVSLRGKDRGLGGFKMNYLGEADKSDPGNLLRLISLRWWDCPLILNQNWVRRIEAGVTANPL